MAARLGITISVGATVAQVAAQFAPVPYLGPAVDVLVGIIQLCAQVASNRYAAGQLRDRCHMLLLAFKDRFGEKGADSPAMQETLGEVKNILFDIKLRMETWAHMKRFVAFAKQAEITIDIQRCNVAITDCVNKFQIASSLAILDWEAQFKTNQEHDHEEIIEYLAEIRNSQTISNGVLESNTEILCAIMTLMQNALGGSPSDMATQGLQSNLYQLQMTSKTLLPDKELKRGEVRRIGGFPVGGSSTGLDIWEGVYLNREKVAIKIVRSVGCNPKSLERFQREVVIWASIWDIDGGKRVVPFYGFCLIDGPYPYMVSPWQDKGTAIHYVRTNPNVNIRDMIRKIGEGILLLHSMSPVVIHGDIKASNIMIGRWGDPLLSDFGIARIVEDITGVPFTMSHGVHESYRWFAPELCIGEGIMSTSSDMFAFGMTILELMTHQPPFADIKHTTEVVIKSSHGIRPPRPIDPQVIARGLDDSLWNLMTRCWSHDPSQRPTIQDIIGEL